ncbi:MAG: GNAT family N-acetyltransferase [Pelolinea sp.]|jgi:ribosomal protein S18 acetylase RimI-like enzyme|nr:GNAT family N-acetyltransferase [Pelolinea sp.]
MAEVMIRTVVSPDFSILSNFRHSIETKIVWQMEQESSEGDITISFRELKLPRLMKLPYPRSSQSLFERWKELSVILVGCVDNVPVGYVSCSSIQTTSNVWIKDVVVHERWRRQGVATTLVKAIAAWSEERGLKRMTLEMSSKNYPAICMAKKLGFEFCGYNDYYYENNDIAIFFARLIR